MLCWEAPTLSCLGWEGSIDICVATSLLYHGKWAPSQRLTTDSDLSEKSSGLKQVYLRCILFTTFTNTKHYISKEMLLSSNAISYFSPLKWLVKWPFMIKLFLSQSSLMSFLIGLRSNSVSSPASVSILPFAVRPRISPVFHCSDCWRAKFPRIGPTPEISKSNLSSADWLFPVIFMSSPTTVKKTCKHWSRIKRDCKWYFYLVILPVHVQSSFFRISKFHISFQRVGVSTSDKIDHFHEKLCVLFHKNAIVWIIKFIYYEMMRM